MFWNRLLNGNKTIKFIIAMSMKKAAILFQIKAGPMNDFSFGKFPLVPARKDNFFREDVFKIGLDLPAFILNVTHEVKKGFFL